MQVTVKHNGIKHTLNTEADDFEMQIANLVQEVERNALEQHGITPEEVGSTGTSSGTDASGSSDNAYERHGLGSTTDEETREKAASVYDEKGL